MRLPGVRQRGLGLLEVMVALLLATTATTGFLFARLEIKKMTDESLQRSIAVTLARDMLERIRVNSGAASSYATTGLGDGTHLLPAPHQDCSLQACSPAQLAYYDLWHWESLLLGGAGVFRAGGLSHGRACIVLSGGVITLNLSWLGAPLSGSVSGSSCPGLSPDIYDDPAGLPGNQRRRRVLSVSTSIPQYRP